jgi:hypothetical protein
VNGSCPILGARNVWRNEDYLLLIDCVTFTKLFDAALGTLNYLSTKVAANIAFAKQTSNCVGLSSWKEFAGRVATSLPFCVSLKYFLEFWTGIKDWFLTPMKEQFEQIEEKTVAFSQIPPKWPGSLDICSQLRKFSLGHYATASRTK